LFHGWNFISGQQSSALEFQDAHKECNISIMWHFNGDTQQWDAWTEDYLDHVYIPEFVTRYFDQLYAYEAYWIYCK
jgi:lipopolysaccharide biosynthesis glycosyltransferase